MSYPLLAALLLVLGFIIFAAIKWRAGGQAIADITLACGESERFIAPNAGTFVIKTNRVCAKATFDILVARTGETHRLKVKNAMGEVIDLEVGAGGVVSVEVQRGDTIILNCQPGEGGCEFTLYNPFHLRSNTKLFTGIAAARCDDWTTVDLWVYATTRVTIVWNSVCATPHGVEQPPEIRGVTAGEVDSGTHTPTPGPAKVGTKFTWQGTLEPGGATGGGVGGVHTGIPFTGARRLQFKCVGSRGGPCQADISLTRP